MLTANECKDLISIESVIKAYELGIDVVKRSKCPFCGSSTGFSIRSDKYFKCFRCSETGDIYKLLQVTKNISFTEAYHLVLKLTGDPSTSGKYIKRDNRLETIFSMYRNEEQKLKAGLNYLKSRGIDRASTEFPIGYVDTKNFLLENSCFKLEDLEELGLISKTGKEIFYNHVIFAYRDLNNRIIHLQGRSLNPEDKLRWVSTSKGFVPISNVVWGAEKLNEWKEKYGFVFLCEGLTDCYSLLSIGLPAIATAGININLARYTEALDGFTIIAVYDGDKYPIGDINSDLYKSWIAVLPALINLYKDSRVNIKCVTLPKIPGVKDINDLLKHFNFNSDKFLDSISKQSREIEDWCFEVFSEENSYWNYIIKVCSVKKSPRIEKKLFDLISSKGFLDYLYLINES